MNGATAASGLRRLPPFEDVSLRLVQDLIEFASQEEREAADEGKAHVALSERRRLWFVRRGVLEVTRKKDGVPRRVGPGRYYLAREGDDVVRPSAGHEGRLLFRGFDRGWLQDAVEASFTLASTLCRTELLDIKVPPEARRAHRILLASDPDREVPLEALAQLLAAGIAVQFDEPVAVVVLHGAGLRLWVWRDGRFEELAGPAEPDDVPQAVLAATDRPVGKAKGVHLVFLHPADPLRLPAWWGGRPFHRVVYLTDAWEIDSRPRRELLKLLHPDLWDPARPLEGPFFSSFIPTVLLRPARRSRAGSWLAPPWPWGRGLDGLEHVAVADDADFTSRLEPIEPSWRLYRDLCRLRLELPELARTWRAPGDKRRFAAVELGDDGTRAAVERWARAVTNRQVGVALSGGGAVNALLVPLLQRIAKRVPIDVVSGVSGGSLLGAFLCKDNPGGLATYRREGLWFQIGLMLAVLDSAAIQRVLDRLLGGPRVEELETRLVAVTTELLDDAVPRARAVVKGTVGQAVRVSGAVPGLFGPAAQGASRYIDGADGLAVPARVLPDFGADIAFAFNAVGPVRGRNLLRAGTWTAFGRGLADFAYRYTPLGRGVDGLVGQFSLLEQASRAAVEEVDVFYEVPPEAIPIGRGFYWLCVDRLARHVEEHEEQWRAVCERCVERWEEFRAGP